MTRIFMPKYGIINERRHQLHEVIRLSGINLIIDDMDMPLILKVASIPKERMQVRNGYSQLVASQNKASYDAAVAAQGPDNQDTKLWWDTK